MLYCMLIVVRSGTIIVVVALLICQTSYCSSALKDESHGYKRGDL